MPWFDITRRTCSRMQTMTPPDSSQHAQLFYLPCGRRQKSKTRLTVPCNNALNCSRDPLLGGGRSGDEQHTGKPCVVTGSLAAHKVCPVTRELRVVLLCSFRSPIVLEEEAKTLVAAAIAAISIGLAAPVLTRS